MERREHTTKKVKYVLEVKDTFCKLINCDGVVVVHSTLVGWLVALRLTSAYDDLGGAPMYPAGGEGDAITERPAFVVGRGP